MQKRNIIYSLLVLFFLACSGIAAEEQEKALQAQSVEQKQNSRVRRRRPKPAVVHDPSRIVARDGYFMFYVTARGPNAGVEERYFAPGSTQWVHNRHLFTGEDRPGWIKELLPDNDGSCWAPDIIEVDGELLMYYSMSEFEGIRNTAVGRAVAKGKAPNMEWFDAGQPVLYSPIEEDSLSVIDPCPFQDEDGRLWLVFGGRRIWITELDKKTGLLKEKPDDFTFQEGDKRFKLIATKKGWVEASYLWKKDGWYYLFVNWGACCRGMRSTYNIRVGRSKNITGPYLDKDGIDLAKQGGSLVLEGQGRFIGPGHTGIYEHPSGKNIFTYHFYDGQNRGSPQLGMSEIKIVDGWPVVNHGMNYGLMWESPAAKSKVTEKSISEGDILWHRPVDDSVESTPAVDNQGNVYVSGSSSVFSYTTNGTHRWTTKVGHQAGEFNAPSLSPDQKVVYGGGANFVYALEASTGKTIWKNTDFDVGFHSVPAISADGSRLYFGVGAERDEGDSFYCIDTSDSSVKWEYVMSHPPQGFHGYLGGAIIGPEGNIYVSSQHGWLISLTDNGDSFTENWAYDVKAEMRMPPSMDADGFLYVGSSAAGGYIHKVHSKTGKSAGGNWPVKTTAGEVFANITIGNDGTIFANSEDHRLWAFNPDGSLKWNNLQFDVWGSDPLIRVDGRIIVGTQLNGAARVACIRDNGDKGVIEWISEPIAKSFRLNETNVNIAPDGTIYIASGQNEPFLLYAIQGNGQGLSTTSPWPKYMGNIQNNGSSAQTE